MDKLHYNLHDKLHYNLHDKLHYNLDNLADPDILANDIIENLEDGIESFKEILITINRK